MNIKLGANWTTLVLGALVVWIAYGSFKGGQVYSAGTTGGTDYTATT